MVSPPGSGLVISFSGGGGERSVSSEQQRAAGGHWRKVCCIYTVDTLDTLDTADTPGTGAAVSHRSQSHAGTRASRPLAAC